MPNQPGAPWLPNDWLIVTFSNSDPAILQKKQEPVKAAVSNECPCSARDLLFWGHRCGRKAKIDTR